MDRKARTRLSKFLSFVLRHDPGAIGIELEEGGWVEVDRLLVQCQANGKRISRRGSCLIAREVELRGCLSQVYLQNG